MVQRRKFVFQHKQSGLPHLKDWDSEPTVSLDLLRVGQESDWPHSPESIGRESYPNEEHINELRQLILATKNGISECLRMLVDISDKVDARSNARTATINSFITDKRQIILKRPLFLLIEEYNDETVARIPEMEVAGFGSVEAEAIMELKQNLGELYQDLVASSDDTLGRLPLSWKQILQELVDTDVRT